MGEIRIKEEKSRLPVDVHNNNNRYLTDLAEILHVVLFWGPNHDSTSKPPSFGNDVLFFWKTRS